MMMPAVKGRKASPASSARVAEHSLQVEGIEEEHREEACCDEEHRDVRGADGADPEDAEPDQRLDRAALDDHEGCEQRDRDPADAERVQRSPALLLRLDDRVDEDEEARRHGDRSREVEALVRALVLRLRDEA